MMGTEVMGTEVVEAAVAFVLPDEHAAAATTKTAPSNICLIRLFASQTRN